MSQPLPSAQEMEQMDQFSIAELERGGVQDGGRSLMNRAALEIWQRLRPIVRARKVLILAGPGNNGGDGLCLARLMKRDGWSPGLVWVRSKSAQTTYQDLLIGLKRVNLVPLTLDLSVSDLSASVVRLLSHFESGDTIIVDALLGNGQSRAPQGVLGALVERINDLGVREESVEVIAVDVPTGVNPSTGEVYSPAVKCNQTWSIQFTKRGLLQSPAWEVVGEVQALEIGIRANRSVEFCIFDSQSVNQIVRRRSRSAHKGSSGHLIVCAGSAQYPGAAWLAAGGGLAVGCGLLTLASVKGVVKQAYYPEVIPLGLGDEELLGIDRAVRVIKWAKDRQLRRGRAALVLGPGLGRSTGVVEFVEKLLEWSVSIELPVVVDADALWALGHLGSKRCRKLLRYAVLTPHPGEASSLLDQSISQIQSDRFSSVKELGELFPAQAVLLKGAGTLIWNPPLGQSQGMGYLLPSGNPYLATGGTGDVLSGFIGGLLAQGYSPVEAALLGAAWHGETADRLVKGGCFPLFASDLIENISQVVAK